MLFQTRYGTDMSRIGGLLNSGAVTQGFLPNLADDGFRMLSPLQLGGIGLGAGLLGNSGSAGGGFLLYPNKANTNMMRSVYAK